MVQWTLVGAVVGAVLFLMGVILGWAVFPPAVHEKIIENVQLVEGTDQFKRWETLPQALDFKVYIFNVTNPLEVQQGKKPKVVEVGPYIYSQYRHKSNIRFSRDKSRVFFTQQQTYEFNRRASAPLTEDDPITVLSIHMNTIVQVAEDESYDSLRLINGEINRMFGKPDSMFIKTTPREFLFDGIPFCEKAFGIALAICQAVEKKKTKTIRKMPDGSLRFSFFYHKNKSDDGVYMVNTGLKDYTSTQIIETWNGNDYVTTWKNTTSGEPSTCNLINGTDASGYPPFIKKIDPIYIFSSDICRSVQIIYEGESDYKGIPALRYTTGDNFLNEIGPEYSTDCFCTNNIRKAITKENGCLYRGAMDLTNCLEAPVVLTLPHMMGAAEEYTSLIDGFKPDPRKHKIFIDVEPNTGTPLQGGKRVQFNMFLRKVDSIKLTDKLQTTLFPVLWIEEGIQLNDDMVKLLNDSLMNVLLILGVVQWGLIVVGLVLMIGMLIWYYFKRKSISTTIEPRQEISRIGVEQSAEDITRLGVEPMYTVKD